MPSASLYGYETRLPGEPSQTDRPGDSQCERTRANPYGHWKARCNSQWKQRTITGLISDAVVEAEGVNWHIACCGISVSRFRPGRIVRVESLLTPTTV